MDVRTGRRLYGTDRFDLQIKLNGEVQARSASEVKFDSIALLLSATSIILQRSITDKPSLRLLRNTADARRFISYQVHGCYGYNGLLRRDLVDHKSSLQRDDDANFGRN